MKVWWCVTHEGEKRPDWRASCWKSAADVWLDGDCRMVEMELHPVGSRVVTAEALVIERDDLGRWPREALRILKEWHSDSMTSEGGILNALARASKAADV